MIPRRFPFQWGAVPTTTPAPTPEPPLWVKVTATGRWGAGASATQLRRFEHLYAQLPGAPPFRDQNLIFTIQTQYPFLIGPDPVATVSSTVSQP